MVFLLPVSLRQCLSFLILSLALPLAAQGWVESLPRVAYRLPMEEYSFEKASRRLRETPRTDIEDLWRFTSDGSLVCLERVPSAEAPRSLMALRMVMVESTNRAIPPGTVMGHLEPTAKPGVYDARIYTGMDRLTGVKPSSPRKMLVRLEGDALQYTRVKKGLSVNWMRLIPIIPRHLLQWRSEDRDGLDGCVRYRDPKPRYL